MTAPPLDIIDTQVFALVREAAEVLRTDERTVRRGIANGTIPAVRIGSATRVPTSWLREAAGLPPPEQESAPLPGDNGAEGVDIGTLETAGSDVSDHTGPQSDQRGAV